MKINISKYLTVIAMILVSSFIISNNNEKVMKISVANYKAYNESTNICGKASTSKNEGDSYIVLFDSADGTPVNPQKVLMDHTPNKEETARDGYLFNGWYLGLNPYDFRKAINQDAILRAGFTKICVITYKDENGTTLNTEQLICGEKPTGYDVKKDGYEFNGWIDENGNKVDTSKRIYLSHTWTTTWTGGIKPPTEDEKVEAPVLGCESGKCDEFTKTTNNYNITKEAVAESGIKYYEYCLTKSQTECTTSWIHENNANFNGTYNEKSKVTVSTNESYYVGYVIARAVSNKDKVSAISNAVPYKKSLTEAGKTWEFKYTGDIKEMTIPSSGTYKLELFGGSGGGDIQLGGYGGYSTATGYFEQGTKLYIVVGGHGNHDNKAPGGYNGGGKSGGTEHSGSGGGATHIALVSGVLSTLESQKDKVLIVAGGGGGSGYGIPASGGGTEHNIGFIYRSGTKQAEQIVTWPQNNDDYLFGQGQDQCDDCDGGGGGGGYFGGRASQIACTDTDENGTCLDDDGGAGGTGYINTDYGLVGETKVTSERPPIDADQFESYGVLYHGYAKITLQEIK